MSWARVLRSRLRGLVGRKRLDRELEEEVRFHLEMQTADNARRGMNGEDAHRATMRSFGSPEVMKDVYRERRSLPQAETILQDIRYACRMMPRNPGFTAIAVLSLAVGIGANCAVFSFADALLLRPLPVARPGGVLTVGIADPFSNSLVASYREYVDLRERSRSFEGLVAFTNSTIALARDIETTPRLGFGSLVSANFFQVMGVEPQLGRDFRSDEHEVPGRDAVVILGHGFWTEHMGADPAVLGRTIRLNNIGFTVVGVAPVGFPGLTQFAACEFYVPLMMWPRLVSETPTNPLEARDARLLEIKGRLKPGETIARAQRELSIIAAGWQQAYPDASAHHALTVRTELQDRVANAPPVAALMGMLAALAVGVLFVSCANVASLLTSRAPARAREMAVRLAIGAGRGRIVRQLITESVLIALAGCGLGLVVAYAGVALFRQFRIPTDLPLAVSFELDWRALLVALVVSIVSALLSGLTPALRATRTGLATMMKSREGTADGRRRWGSGMLVCGQIAVSVVLLVMGTTMFRSFRQHLIDGPGYRIDHLLVMRLDPSLVRYDETQAQQFFDRVAERARQVPGVRSVAVASRVPMDGTGTATIVPEGFQFPAGTEGASLQASFVDESYFNTFRLPILAGRSFRSTDGIDAPRVAIVNEASARRYWGTQDPVGKRFRLNDASGSWTEIVGLARNAKYQLLIEPPRPMVYFPYRQHPQRAMTLVAEAGGDPVALVTPLREAIRSVEANLPVFNVRTMEDLFYMRTVSIFEVIIGLIGSMGAMALALAVVGLYGLVLYAVSRRTREIGVRMAIGADRARVLRMVLGQGLLLVVLGLGVGLPAGAGTRAILAALFPGARAGGSDPFPLALVALVVLIATLVASYVPARRASRVNPTEALRLE